MHSYAHKANSSLKGPEATHHDSAIRGSSPQISQRRCPQHSQGLCCCCCSSSIAGVVMKSDGMQQLLCYTCWSCCSALGALFGACFDLQGYGAVCVHCM
jgi:hypothetical protein